MGHEIGAQIGGRNWCGLGKKNDYRIPGGT